ncbi:hypothetical protein SLH49_16160 [Cognatiyoonia sp. IB215446]|uniref:hypothetical protein n=1 Tax=Cognatiyoonia sp. IB215446 TaxID=3097355 RepID=UPI002A154613|nr:hypothetical protein [Cognatiyoonia sp. IB215446]MDX8349518.1 hypothetical protein [Cognatiyoonia sp. IB215446]
MRRWVYFLPVAALIVFAGYLGLRSGGIPNETEIIDRYAAAYLATAPNGASLTDCSATPHPDDAIRMVINCAHPSGILTTYYIGPRGEALPAPQGPSA